MRSLKTLRRTSAFTVAVFLPVVLATLLQAQGTPPATQLTLITRDGSRPVPTTLLSGRELISLDDVAALFQVTVREDALGGAITVAYRGRTIVASPDQPMASVSGRVVTLPSPVVRSGRRWLVPVEFLPRALAPIYDQRIELRSTSRLLIVGEVRVPRVSARIDAAGPPTRATIEIAPPAAVTVNTEATRVIVRIEADALDLSLPADGAGLVDAIRPGDQRNTVTVAVTAAAGMARATVTAADALTRVAVEVPAAGAPPESSAAIRPPTSSAPSETISIVTIRPAFQTIAIDPGHGGEDVGARGDRGAEEKQLTLDVARRLRGLIEARLGLRVIMTREEDRAVSLDERAAIANNGKADLFLSLHANAALSPTMAGAEVYHLELDREGEEARRDAADAIALPVLGGGARTIDVVRWDLAQARHIESSAAFAKLLEAELRRQVTMSPRPIRQAPLRVLTGANMPAALVEIAYLTNPAQRKVIGGETFKNSVAQGLYEAIVRFRASVESQQTP